MAAILRVWRQIENPTTRQSTHIYLKNTPAKFHPDPISNDGLLGFPEESPQKEQEQEQQDE